MVTSKATVTSSPFGPPWCGRHKSHPGRRASPLLGPLAFLKLCVGLQRRSRRGSFHFQSHFCVTVAFCLSHQTCGEGSLTSLPVHSSSCPYCGPFHRSGIPQLSPWVPIRRSRTPLVSYTPHFALCTSFLLPLSKFYHPSRHSSNKSPCRALPSHVMQKTLPLP